MSGPRELAWLYVALTIGLGVYGQTVLKWQIARAGPLPNGVYAQLAYLFGVLSNLWVLSGIAGAFLAMLFWIAALAVLDLSVAYPFTSAAFVLILLLSHVLFGEPMTAPKLAGMALIVAGLVVGSR